MQSFFKITKTGISSSKEHEANFILQKADDENLSAEEAQLITRYDLPQDIFLGASLPEEVARVEHISGTNLTNPISIVLLDLSKRTELPVEKRLQAVSFILSDELLILNIGKDSNFLDDLIREYGDEISSFADFIAWSLFFIATNFLSDLIVRKKVINDLEDAAKKTTQNKELVQMTNAERDFTYLEQTLAHQHETIKSILTDKTFITELNNDNLIYDIWQRERQAKNLVDVYTRILANISGLFTDMINNNLNHLMKYLNSLTLIISVPTFIVGLWGINTGGLPFRHTWPGFIFVVVLSIITGLLMALHLRRKDYSK